MSVGSTNFGNRSFRLNDEANLNIYNPSLAERQNRIFKADLENSRQVTYEQWAARPLKKKLQERLALLVQSQL